MSCSKRTEPAARERAAGFTLIEVLVALFVVAIALGAALATARTQLRTADHLRTRLYAHWAATDLANAWALGVQDPTAVEDSGMYEIGGIAYAWTLRPVESADANVMRVEVEIQDVQNPDDILAVQTGYRVVSKTKARGAGASPSGGGTGA